jgi:hypothetical protein
MAALGEGGAVRVLAVLAANLEERCEQLQQELNILRNRY